MAVQLRESFLIKIAPICNASPGKDGSSFARSPRRSESSRQGSGREKGSGTNSRNGPKGASHYWFLPGKGVRNQ